MRRGDIWLVDLEPTRGAEADKARPVVLVGNDGANRMAARLGRGVVTVVPLTSNTARVYPFQVLITDQGSNGLDRPSKAQAEQVRSIDATRLVARIGRITPAESERLDAALRLHLAL